MSLSYGIIELHEIVSRRKADNTSDPTEVFHLIDDEEDDLDDFRLNPKTNESNEVDDSGITVTMKAKEPPKYLPPRGTHPHMVTR